jgi:hypothetical protein
MRLEMSTNWLHLIEPGTYQTVLGYFLDVIREEHVNDWLNAMVKHGIDTINEMLAEDPIVAEFGVLKAENGKMRSPQFYNYENDSIEFDLIVPDETVEKIRNAEYDNGFFKWTKQNYGSCSGFVSFFPYTREKFEVALRKSDLDFSMAVAMIIMKYFVDNFDDNDMSMYQGYYEDDVISELENNDWEMDEEDEEFEI